VGPITLGQVPRFLADTACEVKVQPVMDPQDTPQVDGYEIPRRIREAILLRMPASCFPYATTWSPTPGPNTSATDHSPAESGRQLRSSDVPQSRPRRSITK
jgi:hypothetical protein